MVFEDSSKTNVVFMQLKQFRSSQGIGPSEVFRISDWNVDAHETL